MRFFNLGASELMLIFLFAILAIGPKETAKFARQASNVIQSIKGTLSELTSEVTRVASEPGEALKDEISKD